VQCLQVKGLEHVFNCVDFAHNLLNFTSQRMLNIVMVSHWYTTYSNAMSHRFTICVPADADGECLRSVFRNGAWPSRAVALALCLLQLEPDMCNCLSKAMYGIKYYFRGADSISIVHNESRCTPGLAKLSVNDYTATNI